MGLSRKNYQTRRRMTIVKIESIYVLAQARSLYKGIQSPIVGSTILNSFAFGTYGEMKSLTKSYTGTTELQYYHYFVAGGLSGIANSFISSPFEIVKIRMQLDNVTRRQFSSTMQCLKYVVQHFGVRGLYLGFGTNVVREFLFCSTYFAVYETMKHSLRASNGEISAFAIMAAGALSGMSAYVSWF